MEPKLNGLLLFKMPLTRLLYELKVVLLAGQAIS